MDVAETERIESSGHFPDEKFEAAVPVTEVSARSEILADERPEVKTRKRKSQKKDPEFKVEVDDTEELDGTASVRRQMIFTRFHYN
jgi:hypothetical protein